MTIKELRQKNINKLNNDFKNYKGDKFNELWFESFIQQYLVNKNGYNIYYDIDKEKKISGDDLFNHTSNLIESDLFEFIQTTQPKEWKKLTDTCKTPQSTFIVELRKYIDKNGLIYTLRNGLKVNTVKFDIFGQYTSDFRSTVQNTLFNGNIFSVIKEFHYSNSGADKDNRIDLVIFINGFPLITIELKISPNQHVFNAIEQYKNDRDCKNPVLKEDYRSIVHFAMSDDEVYFTTKLNGSATSFLPFNKGDNEHKGNPLVKDLSGNKKYRTCYMWEEILTKKSIVEIFQNFVFKVEEEDKLTHKISHFILWPRYHQLNDIKKTKNELLKQSSTDWWKNLHSQNTKNTTSHHFLFANAAGSGKTYEIAWLSFTLAKLRDSENKEYFDSVIVITDRKVVDRQLQNAITQLNTVYHKDAACYIQTLDETSKSDDVRNYLNKNVKIIVTTIHKFSRIKASLDNNKDKKYGIIIDEAHSSTASELKNNMEKFLDNGVKYIEEEKKMEDSLINTLGTSGNITYFPFTATPKPITKQLFGIKKGENIYSAWTTYSFQQAIEEDFILDVLKHVIIYKLNAGELIKTAEDNPTLPVNKTVKQIKEQIIRCDPKSIKVKCEKIAEYFKDFTLPSCGGVGKAMIVAPSVKTVIEYKKQLETTFKDKSIPKQKILVAYTGEVKGQTETEVNGFSENKTASEFSNDDCRILIVCNKYQTGFDEKKLTTLFVDQPLSGVRAVQTYSRLNRTFRNSKETLIIDFVNALDDIQNSFKPFMKTTELESQFDSKIFLDCLNELASYNFFTESELKEFNTLLMFKFSNQKDLKNQNIELADLSNIINKKIHDINKFSDQQILDNEKKIRYFVKWYPVMYSLFNIRYDEQYNLYKFISMLFKSRNHGWNPNGNVKIEDVSLQFEGEYRTNEIINGQDKETLKSPKIQLAQINLEMTLEQIIQMINDMLGNANILPKNLEEPIKKTLGIAVEEILTDKDIISTIKNIHTPNITKRNEIIKKLKAKIIKNYQTSDPASKEFWKNTAKGANNESGDIFTIISENIANYVISKLNDKEKMK